MIYSVIGAVIGCIGSYIALKSLNCNFSNKETFIGMPSEGEIGVASGIIIGAVVGFGYDTCKLLQD